MYICTICFGFIQAKQTNKREKKNRGENHQKENKTKNEEMEREEGKWRMKNDVQKG